MSESELDAFRQEMLGEFRKLDSRLTNMQAQINEGFGGVHDALGGMMEKLLRPEEATALRSSMKGKTPPEPRAIAD